VALLESLELKRESRTKDELWKVKMRASEERYVCESFCMEL
jgi:hypothetical protein